MEKIKFRDIFIFERDLPTVSIIIPTFNEEKNIGKCLASIYNQNYPFNKLEVILVDGLSTDNTLNIVRNYDSVHIILNKKRIVGNARRLGVENASGDILTFLDADAELPRQNWLQMMVYPFIRNPEIAGTFTILCPKRDYPAISRFFSLVQADPIIAFAHGTGKDVEGVVVTQRNYFPMGSFLARGNLVLKIGNFKSSINRGEDVDLSYRLVKAGYKFILVPEAGLYHLYVDGFFSFVKKTYRRISDFLNRSTSCGFEFIPKSRIKFFKKIFYSITLIGALLRAAKGIKQDRDTAWLYYPLVIVFELFMYTIMLLTDKRGRGLLLSFIVNK